MDLELSDEQRWLSESVDALLGRDDAPDGLWRRLVDFGALAVGGDEGLGAVELCLIARALGTHLAPVPYLGTAAVAHALAAGEHEPAGGGGDAIAVAVLEPGGGWGVDALRSTVEAGRLTGRKAGVEHAVTVSRLAVVAAAPDGPALALVDAGADGITIEAQRSFDPTAPLAAVAFDQVAVASTAGAEVVERLMAIGGLLAAAEAVGAASRLLDDACAYAAERRQFGRPIGSFQALRHLLADLYVRQASSWSSVLYAAATLDEDAVEGPRTASIAKAYVSRAAREVAHGAIQVFGGIAITDEHPAHRFLRRIVVREQQFGDAAHHERALGRALARAGSLEPAR
jgi:alkylation response protein AidB-like acyl-CoA dehydrogenase